MSDRTSQEIIQIGNRAFHRLFTEEELGCRPLTDAEFEHLCESVRAFGVMDDIVADETGGVLDGWNRIRAAKSVGATTVPVRVLTGLSLNDKFIRAKHYALRRPLVQGQIETRNEHILSRRERMRESRQQGESLRTIAEREGVSQSTVHRNTSDVVPPPMVTSRDGRNYPSTASDNGTPRGRPKGPRKATPIPDVLPTNPAAANVIYDSLNVAVPELVRDAFETRSLITTAVSKLREAREAYEKACASPAGRLLKAGWREADTYLDRLASSAHQHRPYAVCTACQGVRTNCNVCKSTIEDVRGWIIRAVLAQAPRS